MRKIKVFDKEYDTIVEALSAYDLTAARYYRWKNYFSTPGEVIEEMIKKDEETRKNREKQRILKEEGISLGLYNKFKDQSDDIYEVIRLINENKKKKEEDREITAYREKKGVSYDVYMKAKSDPKYEGMSWKEVIDSLPVKGKVSQMVHADGVEYSSVRAFLSAWNLTIAQYDKVRDDCETAQEAVDVLVEKFRGREGRRSSNGKKIVVDGKEFESITEFCSYMQISTRSFYSRYYRYGKDKTKEEYAQCYYDLVKKAGGTKDKKVFHRLSVKIDGVFYHGLDDFLSKNKISKKEFNTVRDFYDPELPLDKWFMVARHYDKLKEQYQKDRKKFVRGKKYKSVKELCDEYGVSKSQMFWYRDTYFPGADVWDVAEEYLKYKEERKGELS